MQPMVTGKTVRPASSPGLSGGAMDETLDWLQSRSSTTPVETKSGKVSWLILTIGAVAAGLAVGGIILLF